MRVLIAEDEPELRSELKLFLERQSGVSVVATENGRRALEAWDDSFDVVLTDIRMPDLDGLTLLEELQRRMPGVPVVLLTAAADTEIVKRALRHGAFDYLNKPVAPSELRRVLARARSRRRRQRRSESFRRIWREGYRSTRQQLEAIQGELERARSLQGELLPQAIPETPGLEGALLHESLSALSGDFYDFVPLSDGRLGIFLGDIAGHGVSSAMLHGMLKLAFRDACVEATPSGVLRRMHERLRAEMGGYFATAIYAVFEPRAMRLHSARAGHPPPLLWRADRSGCDELWARGSVLGVDHGVAFETLSVPVHPGDRVLLYTDGIIEERVQTGRGRDRLFGVNRLKEIMARTAGAALSALPGQIRAELQAASGRMHAADDLTAIAVEFKTPV